MYLGQLRGELGLPTFFNMQTIGGFEGRCCIRLQEINLVPWNLGEWKLTNTKYCLTFAFCGKDREGAVTAQ